MNNSQSHHTPSFLPALASLNPAQRQAVDNIEGPVLVIAGPGTGKTQILAVRIGNILQQPGISASNILCLTYTDTGRVEMRNRLFSLIGPAAYRVHIHTFHSFCNEVIQENISYFGKQNLQPVSELEELELLNDLLNKLPSASRLKSFKGDLNYEVKRVKKLFDLYKKENWSEEFLNNKIDAYLNDLPLRDEYIYKRNGKGFKKGDLKADALKEETERMEKLREAVKLYPEYDKAMNEKGRYTYNDMLLWVLNTFKDNAGMLLNYQERYLYFLVDEFQDTSGSQKTILEYLIDYWDTPNVFVVGDDDQSIYAFQGANVKNISDFADKYANGLLKVMLTENYRSTQNILDAAKVLIDKNEERFINIDTSLNKNLVASNPEINNLKIPPEIIEYANTASETICVAKKIEELIKNENVKPSEIAVIYRNHSQVEAPALYLQKKGINVNMKRNEDLLKLPFVQKILTILRYIADENDSPYSGEELLFEILHFDFYDIQPIKIAELSIKVAKRNYANRNEKYSLRKAISEDENGSPNLFSPTEKSNLNQFSDKIENLIKAANNLTMQGLFEEVVRESGILEYIMQSTEKQWLMQVVTALFDFIKAETKSNPDITLQGLFKRLDTMYGYDLRLELVKISNYTDGVNLMTAHSSKGTEYNYVFLIGCNKKNWDVKKSSGQFEFKLPDNLITAHFKTDEMEESRRLFYVAMTRAKTHLIISYPLNDSENNNKPLEMSSFVGEIIEGTRKDKISEQADDTTITNYLTLQFTATPAPQIELVDKMFIDAALENYSLSVTHLNSYLDCPIRFYYQHLIKVPAAKGEYMAFGTAVHSTLQQLFKRMKDNANVFPSKEIMLEDFRRFMYFNRESFTKEQYKRRLDYGNKILPPYYDFYSSKWNKIVILEKNISNVEVEGVPLKGQLDKLEFDGKKVNVVDYKTGRYDNAKKKLKAPNAEDPVGGDYWRQAVFYKILLDNQHYNDWDAISSEFDFIEPVKDEYKTEKFIIQKEDIHKVLEQITDTWEKIQKHEFNKGCNKEDCHWCNFVKENNMQVALHEVVEEE